MKRTNGFRVLITLVSGTNGMPGIFCPGRIIDAFRIFHRNSELTALFTLTKVGCGEVTLSNRRRYHCSDVPFCEFA